MNVISAIILDANKNGRSFTFSIPLGATYDETKEVLSDIEFEINRMQEEARKQKEEEAPQEVEQ